MRDQLHYSIRNNIAKALCKDTNDEMDMSYVVLYANIALDGIDLSEKII